MFTHANYISISNDGSITHILRDLNLRTPTPFDWINTNIESIDKCFKDNFKHYHDKLRNVDIGNVIDEYGFVFKSDYTINNAYMPEYPINNKIINIVAQKYKNRIDEFNKIMSSPIPIICLCDYSIEDVIHLQELFIKYYNRTNEDLYIINISLSTSYDNVCIPSNIYKVNLTHGNMYIWKYMIDLVLRHIKTKNIPIITTTQPLPSKHINKPNTNILDDL